MKEKSDKRRPVTEQDRKNCRNKVRYESAFAAKFFGGADGLRAYPCPACGGFHLTSSKVHLAKKFRA